MKRLLAISLVIMLCVGTAGQTAQQTKKQKLEREIEQLEKQLKKTNAKQSDALNTLNLLRKKTENRKKLINESDREIRVLNDSIYACQKQINLIQDRLDTMSLYYSRLVKNAYKNRDAKIWYMYILASENIGQASRRYGYLKNLSSQMNAQARKIEESRDELKTKLEQMKRLRSRAQVLKKSRERELTRLRSEESQNKKLIASLKKDKSKYLKQLNSKRTQVQALDRQIKSLIAKNVGKSGSKGSKPIDYKLSARFEENKGKLPWPVNGPVVGSFGQHYHPVYTNVKLPFNNGINIAAGQNAEVKSVFEGVVKNVIVMSGYGKCVLIQHGGYFTFYCKLGGVSVKAGQKVVTGQKIGTVDTIDGLCQLHFELWKGSSAQNPESWLR